MKDLIMSNTPIPLSRPAAEQALGLAYSRVTGRADKWFFLDGTIDRALRADSCLVEPADGDLVLVCGGATAATSFILAVLTSADAARSTVTLPGGAALENLDETRAGRMRLQVAERFHLKARHASVIAEGQVKIDAEKIDLG
jgi:hypothetical protein